jgi:hypothetical protein
MSRKKNSTKTNLNTKALNRVKPCNKQKKWIGTARQAHTQAVSKAWRATLRANAQVRELAKRQARDTGTPTSPAVVIRLVKIFNNRKLPHPWSPWTSRRGPQTNRRLIQKSKTLTLRSLVRKDRNMLLTNNKTKHLNSTKPINTRRPSALQAKGSATLKINHLLKLRVLTAPANIKLVPWLELMTRRVASSLWRKTNTSRMTLNRMTMKMTCTPGPLEIVGLATAQVTSVGQ